jgi:phosphatidylglycerophosphate synthase
MGRVSRLGIALDPIADKIFAGGLVVLLVIYRDMPIWLMIVILGRDFLILGLGLVLMRGRQLSLPSNLTGKYAFTAITIMLGSYVIGFGFGVTLFTPLTLILLGASIIAYGRVFLRVRAGLEPPVFRDRPSYRMARIVLMAVVSIVFLVKLYLDFFG